MGLFSFRQWAACVTTVAMLFSAAVPFGFCICDGCLCENSFWHLIPGFTPSNAVVANEKCCCTPPEPLSNECCGLQKAPCSCSCGNAQNDAIVPAVPTFKLPNAVPAWRIVSVISVDFANVSGMFSLCGNHQAMPPSHVPLHVLLCVFLN